MKPPRPDDEASAARTAASSTAETARPVLVFGLGLSPDHRRRSTVSTAKNAPDSGAPNPAATPAPAPAASRGSAALALFLLPRKSAAAAPLATERPTSTAGPSGPREAPPPIVEGEREEREKRERREREEREERERKTREEESR